MTNNATDLVVYRCVCGHDVKLVKASGGICQHCQREISPEVAQNAVAATVSISNLTESTAFQLHIDQEEDPYIGSRFGHFELEECLGRGGMGWVYRALDTSLQRYVAVKVLRPVENPSGDDSRISSMLQEAVSQARMNHPNVVTVYYVGRQDGEPFLAMEMVTGGTLRDRQHTGELTYENVIHIGIEVAQALAHAERFGVIHADIKPSNLLVGEDNVVKLSDFGLSRPVSGTQEATRLSGTPAYLAPEVLHGVPLSQKSDMYALGVTLFELLFGRYPFELSGNTLKEQLRSHGNAEIDFPKPWPRHVPREFAAVIERLLAKNPEDRYPSYQELIGALSSILPVSSTTAGFALRAMAYSIDQSLLVATFIPFALIISLILNVPTFSAYVWAIPFVAVIWLMIPTAYVFLIRQGIRSAGRFLFQLRVVDDNGLPLRKSQRGVRELLRSSITFTAPIATFAGNVAEWFDSLVTLLGTLFVVANLTILVYSRFRFAIHDYLCHSRVVLDVTNPPARTTPRARVEPTS